MGHGVEDEECQEAGSSNIVDKGKEGQEKEKALHTPRGHIHVDLKNLDKVHSHRIEEQDQSHDEYIRRNGVQA